jgi:epoxyqueuosine reductase
MQSATALRTSEHHLKEQIRVKARALGFTLCGFARVSEAPHAEFVRQWIAGGNAGEMGYLERSLPERLDPRRVVPEARSVITVGHRYQPPPLPPVDWQRDLRGRVAAYAYGTDYHRTVARQLEALAAHIDSLRASAVVHRFVDTRPLLEREWAALGGLGWFGKNTNLLHTSEGSYFFIGALLTDVEFEADLPVANRCGTCTRCLDLCPTAALKPGYELDARLCISYLTIEHRGVIPVELRRKMGHWIFGCDVCQEVCPWNDKTVGEHDAAHTLALQPYLPDLARLTETDFRRRFRHSAIRRAKRDGLVRNVMVALGNTRNPAAASVLVAALHDDPAALVRAHAAWALAEIGGQRARLGLEAARRREPDAVARTEIETALRIL